MITDSYGNKWYKGNLHTHTTSSDGAKTPEEVKRLYKELGYDFIALTDHWHVNEPDDFEGMLVLSGVEYDTETDGCYHIVGFGLRSDPGLRKGAQVREMTDAIRRCGGVVTLAHPAWSLQRPDKMAELDGIDCTEIYNSVSGCPYSARPYSGTLIDIASVMGFRATLTATDDTHFYGDEVGRGFVYVKAEEPTRDAIINAILKGDVVPTNGPFISAKIEDGYYVVRCEEGCRYVQFFTNRYYSPDTTTIGGTVYEARFRLRPPYRFVRAEAVGFDGRVAYTQYSYID